MSLDASDVHTDEECEYLVEDGLSLSLDVSETEKRTRKKRSSAKPPLSPRSPYLSSLHMNTRKVAVAAWRLPRASLEDSIVERADALSTAASARLSSLSNGHELYQTVRTERDVSPEFPKQTLHTTRKHKHSLTSAASNGYTQTTTDFRTKEDMYDQIIHLKKSLQEHKSDNQKMKAKLRRLEEENAKREKQIEELLDPTKGPEYTRSFVDPKKNSIVIVNGLKQRILKLEQQCREKENSLSKLQSDLRTTNLEELKITADTYFEEIQRLRMLLEAAEKRSQTEGRGFQKQQKALSSQVLRLSEKLTLLNQENTALREELNTDSPAERIKGYREWSKQRLVRRLLEVEKRLGDSRRHAHSEKNTHRLDQEEQTTATEVLDVAREVTMATEAGDPVGKTAEDREVVSILRRYISQLEKERAELQKTVTSKDDNLKRLRAEREETAQETERWISEHTNDREKERREHKLELEHLQLRIQALEESQDSSQLSGGLVEGGNGLTAGSEQPEALEEEQKEQRMGVEEKRKEDKWKSERRRDVAARAIQTSWRDHRDRDIVMLQSALRGHLLRETQLRDLQNDTHNKAILGNSSSDVTPSADGEPDVVAVTTIQSAFRGHLARCGLANEGSEYCIGSPMGNALPTLSSNSPSLTCTSGRTAEMELRGPPDTGGATAIDSDDSDDIIVSPSRPFRARETLLL